MLFVEDVVAPGIVGATVELAVFPVPQDQIATAARTFATGHGSVAALFETNIGSTGSFSLTEQEVGDRARFYIDLGKFLADTTKLAQLKNKMFLFAETLEDIRDCVRRLNAELENPLGL